MARRPFRTADALIIVSTDGYFDVFPPAGRGPTAKPIYRGGIAELGASLWSSEDRLTVRPDSVALQAAVSVWSRAKGAAAVRGELGHGRDGSQ